MTTTKQVWECETCGHRYKSPLAVLEVICPKPHPRNRSRVMKLVEGEPNRRDQRNVASRKV